MKNRVIFIDFIKGVAIACVVLLHINYNFYSSSLYNLSSIIGALWHVPVFFVVSGYFLSENKLALPIDFIKSKIKPLYLKPLYLYLTVTLLHNLFVRWGWVYEYILVMVKNIFMFAREDLCGAMWYVDSLLIGLVAFSVITYIVNRISSDGTQRILIRFIIIFALACMSNILTNKFNLTIPRISNSLSALLLLQMGLLLGKHFNLRYNNVLLLLFCVIIFFYYVVTDGSVSLNNNRYTNIPQLVFSSLAVFYILAYIGHKYERSMIVRFFSYCGTYSFWIMGLHFIAFKICTSAMISLQIASKFAPVLTTPPLNDDILFLFIYWIVGLLLPIAIIKIWNILYLRLINIFSK